MNKIENNVVQTNVCKQELQDKSSFLSQMVETTMIVNHLNEIFSFDYSMCIDFKTLLLQDNEIRHLRFLPAKFHFIVIFSCDASSLLHLCISIKLQAFHDIVKKLYYFW